MVDRRELLKGMSVAAAAVTAGAAATTASAAEVSVALGPYATPWDPPDPVIPGRQNVVPVPEDYYIPGRFAGKTAIVTGCARGMGRLAAIRLAREGANVVGVDWLGEDGRQVIDEITKSGGKATFVEGDISDTAVCDAMVKAAVDT